MEERELLFGLHEQQGIGWKSIDKIRTKGMLTDDVFKYEAQDWRLAGLSEKMSQQLAGTFTADWIAKRRLLMEESRIQMVTVLDKDYPVRLKELPQPPWVLYYRGRLELASAPSIAMVGTRMPTAYGRKVGEMLAAELSGQGFAVVSGLARGIDRACHEAALAGIGGTVAIVATGLDKVYPPENRELEREIARKGLVISEYPIGTASHPGLFPQRNRIIAGLALGTVVVEADSQSGSLITADIALDASRDIFAVPGPITSPKSRGTLELIKQGAKLVTCTGDITEEYAGFIAEMGPETVSRQGVKSGLQEGFTEKNLTSNESHLYHILHQGPFTLDELLERTGWDFGLLHSVLLSLIIKKAATQLPGAIYKVI
ncbi:DNA-processing protein DprA [Paenibacillus sp. NFR01]|uniref:DNA-processing protein DprA n=1 Tax=Paenibacillus sp. NFR01 TaxID=1566279 RepID=UPI0008B79DF5|nr:DNA-processing protein DprA [Paenibacillus sp. NFR01]SET44183.1 DNA processing protein [Paenibacillus sp. NFR01]